MTGITDPTEEYFKDGQWAWDGTRWQKLLCLLPKAAAFENLSLPAGSSTQLVLTIPTGETWRITNVTYQYIGTITGLWLLLLFNVGGVACDISYRNPVVSGTIYQDSLDAVLAAGDTVSLYVSGATLNDDLRVWVLGCRIH